MSFRLISTRRLHVLYSTPLLLSLACIILILSSLCGLVPWHHTSGSILIVKKTSQNSTLVEKSNETASFYFGLLGSCYRPSKAEKLQCTSSAFPPDLLATIEKGGSGINAPHLQLALPELPPVFMSWAAVSLLALVCEILGSLPFYIPRRFGHCSRFCYGFFTAALWILGLGWALGFSAVLALACFAQSFGEEYNAFSADFFYNTATPGSIFVPQVIALVVQILIGIATIVKIENSSKKDSFINSSTWSNNLRVTGP
ncbi:hypothetical protein BY996DRAFT_4584018 [Phakopsora pachyrhizi]|uniref:Uncharacterized protein n=1 Tax=Phakopsora pachyrhizi TaxID=170000 RepID=A0AAV0AZ19_PHAPC|nr:hypothetical protein BY996DRAFT_4584018 [Phakopsora pachyrhizi]CAH7674582.1 hypothetical protein PPACK8108_LOCUS9483 [Phakopsora pachyrhizi]